MKDSFFLDTGILVYCFDATSKKKYKIASDLVDRGVSSKRGVIGPQVVQEFLNAATSKFAVLMPVFHAESYLSQFLKPLCRVFSTIDLYRESLVTRESMKISFYDALIISAALSAGCTELYSEDLQAARTYRGLTIVNPFL